MEFVDYQPESFADWYKNINNDHTETVVDLAEEKREVNVPKLRASLRSVGNALTNASPASASPARRNTKGTVSRAAQPAKPLEEEARAPPDSPLEVDYVSDGGLSYITQ